MPDLITVENRIPLAKAGELVDVAPSTVFRWTQGTHGVRLAHARLGRRMYTSEPALIFVVDRDHLLLRSQIAEK